MLRIIATGLPIALLTGCWLYPGPHAPRYGELSISGTPDAVCIRSNEKGELFDPYIVSIGSYGPDRVADIWEQKFPAETGFMVAASDCLPIYPENARIPLRTGVAYNVSMMNQSSPVRTFHASFCVINRSGRSELHQVRYEKSIGGRDWTPCELPGPPPH